MNRDEPGHNWNILFCSLIGFFPYVPHDEAPAECAWKVGPTQKRIAEDFLRAEAPFVPEVDRVIQELCSSGSASTDSPAVRYFLGLRAAAVNDFWGKFDVVKDGVASTIIPPSSLPALQVLKWFMIDWWRKHGPRYICGCRLLDETLPWEESGSD
jgi:hypothetical protein